MVDRYRQEQNHSHYSESNCAYCQLERRNHELYDAVQAYQRGDFLKK